VPLNLADKKAIVDEVSKVANQSVSLVAADYRGLSVPDLTDLRQKAREANVYLRVVRNTLARRALKGTSFECIEGSLTGPTLLGFSETEPSGPARLFKDFAKTHNVFEVKALSLGGQCYDAKHLDFVASLPTRDEAFSQLAAALLAPATKLARLLAEPSSQLARGLQRLAEQKEGVKT